MTIPDNLTEVLAADPGNELFIEYAEKLRNEGNSSQGILVCLKGLTANPAQHRGRFLLARIYYELGLIPFAVKELKEISRALPEVDHLKRLIARFEPGSNIVGEGNTTVSETVAESEFDVDNIELLEEE